MMAIKKEFKKRERDANSSPLIKSVFPESIIHFASFTNEKVQTCSGGERKQNETAGRIFTTQDIIQIKIEH